MEEMIGAENAGGTRHVLHDDAGPARQVLGDEGRHGARQEIVSAAWRVGHDQRDGPAAIEIGDLVSHGSRAGRGRKQHSEQPQSYPHYVIRARHNAPHDAIAPRQSLRKCVHLYVMAGLVPAIHVLLTARKTWMPATSAGMTLERPARNKEEHARSPPGPGGARSASTVRSAASSAAASQSRAQRPGRARRRATDSRPRPGT